MVPRRSACLNVKTDLVHHPKPRSLHSAAKGGSGRDDKSRIRFLLFGALTAPYPVSATEL
jgi:hypothetical protein